MIVIRSQSFTIFSHTQNLPIFEGFLDQVPGMLIHFDFDFLSNRTSKSNFNFCLVQIIKCLKWDMKHKRLGTNALEQPWPTVWASVQNQEGKCLKVKNLDLK